MKLARLRKTRYWPLLMHATLAIFFALILTLLIIHIRKVDWAQVGAALSAYRPSTLLLAGLCTAVTYTIYSCFDLLGCTYANVKVRVRHVMSIAFVSYACNQNFGALLGTVGLRLRLYSQLGLSKLSISRLILFSVVANWAGYAAIGGLVFVCGLVKIPPQWAIGQTVLQVVGVLLLLLVLGYLYFCAFAKRRHLSIRGRHFVLPPIRLAVQQVALPMLHWPATAAIIYVLLHGRIEFVTILGTYMLSSVAAVIARIPAGLGVLEGIFIAVLGQRVAQGEVLAAILAFRAFFNLSALAIAGLIYLGLEATMQSDGSAVSADEALHRDLSHQHTRSRSIGRL